MPKSIYILHESGTKSHFIGLEELAKKEHLKVLYREFSVSRKLLKGIWNLDFKLIGKQFINITFFLKLPFLKSTKVVFGIAPYDWRLVYLRWL